MRMMSKWLEKFSSWLVQNPVAGLVALAFAAHIWSLPSGFMADDFAHVQNAAALSLSRPQELLRAFELQATDLGLTWYTSRDIRIRYFRPLSTALFVAQHRLWGLHPQGYHATNLLLNALAVLLVWRIAQRLLPSPRAALLAGIVFAIHPTTNEAVNWISSLTDLLAALTALCYVALMLRVADRSSGRRLAMGTVAAMMFGFGLLAKESAIVAPALALIAALAGPDRGSKTKWPERLLAALPFLLPAAPVAAGYFYLRSAVMDLASAFPPSYYIPPFDPRFPMEAFTKFAAYTCHYLFFMPLEPFVCRQIYGRHPIMLAGAFVFSIVVIWKILRPRLLGREWWLILWPVAALAPSMLVFLGKRFLYTATTGVALILGIVLDSILDVGPEPVRWWRFTADRRRLVTGFLIVLVALLHLYEFSAFAVTYRIDELVREMVALVPDPAPDAEFCLVTAWFAMGLGLDHALQLQYGRPDIGVSIWSIILLPEELAPVTVTWLNDRTLTLRTAARDGLLGSDASTFFLWGNPFPIIGQWYDVGSHRVRADEISDGKVRQLTIEFTAPPDPRQYPIITFSGEDLVLLEAPAAGQNL